MSPFLPNSSHYSATPLIDPAERLPLGETAKLPVFVYLPDKATVVYDQSGSRLPVPEFANGFSLTVDVLFGWLLE